MSGRIPLLLRNLESVASRLNVAPEGCRPIRFLSRTTILHLSRLIRFSNLTSESDLSLPRPGAASQKDGSRPNDQLAIREVPGEGAALRRYHSWVLPRHFTARCSPLSAN